MKRLAKAGIAGVLFAAATSSASAVELWQGHLFITTATNACANANVTVGRFFNAVYRPAGLPDNGPDSGLALFGTREATRYSVNGALSGSGQYDAGRITPGAGIQNWSGNYGKASVKPSSPSATTKTLVIKVRLAKFGNTPNCTVTLQGSLGKRPNL